jgi:hypothetical protein
MATWLAWSSRDRGQGAGTGGRGPMGDKIPDLSAFGVSLGVPLGGLGVVAALRTLMMAPAVAFHDGDSSPHLINDVRDRAASFFIVRQ